MLSNLRYSMQGMQDGVAWQEGRARQKADDLRRAEMDALAQQDRARQMAEHQQDRDISLSDREEFGLPEKRARADAIKQQESDRLLRVEAGQAYAALLRGDPKPTADFYTNRVADGHAANIQILPDGRIQIQHPNGSVIAKDADEVWMGKEDGTGMGLYQLAFPDQLAETVQAGRKERASRKVSLEDEDRQNTRRMREIWAQRAPMPQYGMDADNNMVLISGTGAKPVMMGDKPLTGATLAGRGGRMGGAGGNPFGNSAESQRLWNGVQMVRATDPDGKLGKMPDYAVAKMVSDIAQAGKSRSERMNLAVKLVSSAAKDLGQYGPATPQEIQERAEALVGVVDTMAGPQPTMQYSMDQSTSDMIPDPGMPTRKVVRRGMAPDGTRVVMFDDGSIEAE